MVTHIDKAINVVPMKTTLEISDPLLREARKLAARERTTLRALVEQGLRQVVSQKQQRSQFRLRDASFKGSGLWGEANANWEQIRDLTYEGRGS